MYINVVYIVWCTSTWCTLCGVHQRGGHQHGVHQRGVHQRGIHHVANTASMLNALLQHTNMPAPVIALTRLKTDCPWDALPLAHRPPMADEDARCNDPTSLQEVRRCRLVLAITCMGGACVSIKLMLTVGATPRAWGWCVGWYVVWCRCTSPSSHLLLLVACH